MKKWITKIIVNKIVKLAMEKADIKEQLIKAADFADSYADKYLGEKTSQEIQNQICDYIDTNIKIFTDRLKTN